MQPGPELVDIVDDHDVVIRTATRAEMRAGRLMHRCVFIAVVHPDGRLLVHQRSESKDVWPGRWDVAVGGVVTVGETYDAAAERELAEEVGIAATPEPLGVGRYVDDDVALFGRCYRVVHPGPFTFTDGEITQARWVTMDELTELRRTTSFLPDSLALLLPLLT